MPWSGLAGRLTDANGQVAWPAMPLTLATLRLTDDAPLDAVAFHTKAEIDALTHWAAHGGLILILAAADRAELTMLSPESVEAVTSAIRRLPLVMAGLARYDVRAVLPIRLAGAAGDASAASRTSRTLR